MKKSYLIALGLIGFSLISCAKKNDSQNHDECAAHGYPPGYVRTHTQAYGYQYQYGATQQGPVYYNGQYYYPNTNSGVYCVPVNAAALPNQQLPYQHGSPYYGGSYGYGGGAHGGYYYGSPYYYGGGGNGYYRGYHRYYRW